MSLLRYRNALVNLFIKLHQLQRDPTSRVSLALEIQEELFKRIVRAERNVRAVREANKAINLQLARRRDGKTAQALKLQLQRGKDRIEQQRTLMLVLRTVGDSVAFIYGDRWEIVSRGVVYERLSTRVSPQPVMTAERR
jgi:hypothetical protein